MNSSELNAIFEHLKQARTLSDLVDLFAELPPVKSAIEIEMRILAFRKIKERLFASDPASVEALKREVEAMKRTLGPDK